MPRSSKLGDAVEMTYNGKGSSKVNGRGNGPVDLDELFEEDDEAIYDDDDSLFFTHQATRDDEDFLRWVRAFSTTRTSGSSTWTPRRFRAVLFPNP